jgi:hypothetical protein
LTQHHVHLLRPEKSNSGAGTGRSRPLESRKAPTDPTNLGRCVKRPVSELAMWAPISTAKHADDDTTIPRRCTSASSPSAAGAATVGPGGRIEPGQGREPRHPRTCPFPVSIIFPTASDDGRIRKNAPASRKEPFGTAERQIEACQKHATPAKEAAKHVNHPEQGNQPHPSPMAVVMLLGA